MKEPNLPANLPGEKEPAPAPHKRRTHYKGRYPKNFKEKYKELQPEKYTGIAEHVTGKGNTPAGTHIPIMVEEILDFLQIQPGQTGLDATLGYGGHTQAMLKNSREKGTFMPWTRTQSNLKKQDNAFINSASMKKLSLS